MSNVGINVRWADNTAQLRKNLEEGLDQIEVTRASVDKLAKSLGGENLIRGANALVAALQKVGGEGGAIAAVERQTNSERERTIATLQKAIDKYTALGRTAPSAMKEVLAAAQAAQRPMMTLAEQAANVDRQFERFSGDKLIANANAIASAIERIGGASKLTASNQDAVNREVTQAIEQYRALGMEAPQKLVELANATKQVEQPTSAASKWVADLKTNVVAMAAGFISAQAVIGAVSTGFHALVGFLKDSVKSAADAEAAQSKLTAALRAQHTLTPEVINQYNDLSREMQRTTVFSDDLTTEMQALLVQVGGVMPTAMQGALKASADLAAGLGIDLQTATNLVAKAAAGHTETLGRYGITVSDAELKSKGFSAVLEAINRQFGGQAAAQVETYTGKVEQLANAWDDFKEAVGQAIILDPIVLSAITKLNDKSADASESQFTLASATDKAFEASQRLAGFLPGVALILDHLREKFHEAEESAALFNATMAALARGDDFLERFRAAAQDRTAQDIVARGMAEGAKLADEEAKKRKALADAIAEHTRRIREQADVLSGRKAAGELKDLLEAWNKLTPAEKANEQTVARVLDAYEALRGQVDESALPADLESLRTEIERTDGVMRSRAIPGFLQVAINLEQMRNLSKGFTADGLIPMNAAFTDAGRSAAGLATYLERLKTTRDTLAAAVANQNVPMPVGTAGIAGADRSGPNPIADSLKQGLDEAADVITQAFANGGKIAEALRAAASKIGAAVGQAIGTAIGGEVGGQVGQQIGALAEMIGEKLYDALTTSPGEDVMHRVGRRWGIQITEAMGDQIAADAKTLFHGSRQAAEIFNLGAIFDAAGGINKGNFAGAVSGARDVFALIAQGEMAVAQGAKVIDDVWADLLEAGTDTFGFIDGRLRELIQLNAQYGTQSKEIAAFLKAQGEAAVKGSNAAIAARAKDIQAWVALKKKIDDARTAGQAFDGLLAEQRKLAADNRGELEDLGTIALATFSAAVAAGASFAEALEMAQPGLHQLAEGFDALGISADNAALKALLLQSTILDRNPALLQAVSGLGQSFVALSNLGVLNVDTFRAMERTGLQAYSRLQGEVAAVGGTTKDALIPMQDYLHRAQKAAEELGIPLDENTQMLIDQSKELGVWKETGKSATDKLIGGMETLVDKVQELIDTLRGIPDVDYTVTEKRRTEYDPSAPPIVPNKYNDDGSLDLDGDPSNTYARGGRVTSRGTRYLATGGSLLRVPEFKPIGTDVVPAMLTPGEYVLTAHDQQVIGDMLASAGSVSSGSTGSATPAAAAQYITYQVSAIDARSFEEFLHRNGAAVVRATNTALDNSGQLRAEHKEILGVSA